MKRLKGVLPVEVMTDRRDLATATELGKAQGKTFPGDGVRLSVQSVQSFGNGGGQQCDGDVVARRRAGLGLRRHVHEF